MDLGLKGKKVILTGGSRGIGRASVELFAAEGADVAFCSRNADQVAETVASLEKHGGKVFGSAFDMESGHDAYRAWLSSAAEALGGCDIFVPMISTSGAGATGDWQKGLDYDIMSSALKCWKTTLPHRARAASSSPPARRGWKPSSCRRAIMRSKAR